MIDRFFSDHYMNSEYNVESVFIVSDHHDVHHMANMERRQKTLNGMTPEKSGIMPLMKCIKL